MAKIVAHDYSAQHRFEAAILEAVDSAFLEFGGPTGEALYFFLARMHSISRHDIPKRFGDFILALRSEFGIGGRTLEALILDKLYEKVGPNSQDFQTAALIMALLSPEFKGNLEEPHAGS